MNCCHRCVVTMTGRIVNCSSVLGFTALPFRGAYNATKFAMEGLSRYSAPGTRRHRDQSGTDRAWTDSNTYSRKLDTAFRALDRHRKHRQERVKYEQTLIPRLYRSDGKKDRFELEPSAVTARLIHAIESSRPRARYFVTTPTWISAALKRALPTKTFDRFCLSY